MTRAKRDIARQRDDIAAARYAPIDALRAMPEEADAAMLAPRARRATRHFATPQRVAPIDEGCQCTRAMS